MNQITRIPNITLPAGLLGQSAQFRGFADKGCLTGDVILRRGRVVGMVPAQDPQGCRRFLFPALTEPHCHLDKCHTIDRLDFQGGDLAEAIAAQRSDKANWTIEDIRSRAQRGLSEAIDAGCQTMRSHVDWGSGPKPPTAWHVLLELAQETRMTLQLAPLTGIDQMADPAFARSVAAIVPDGHALGALVLGHARIRDGLRNMFSFAAKFGLPLDFHVDETLDPALNGLEAIADAALETSFEGPVLCGHAVSLATRPVADFNRISDKLSRAGITVAALPSTNLFLQGRDSHVATQRGLTPIRALAKAGVRVVVGSDNIRDAFCPVGRHDPMRALELALMAGHLDPPLDRWLRMITTDARAALGMCPIPIDGAHLGALRIADARDLSDIFSGATHRPATDLLKGSEP